MGRPVRDVVALLLRLRILDLWRRVVADANHNCSSQATASSQMVRQGADLYVRSVNGPADSWFRGTRAHHEGQVRRPDGGRTKWAYFLLALKAQDHALSRRASVS